MHRSKRFKNICVQQFDLVFNNDHKFICPRFHQSKLENKSSNTVYHWLHFALVHIRLLLKRRKTNPLYDSNLLFNSIILKDQTAVGLNAIGLFDLCVALNSCDSSRMTWKSRKTKVSKIYPLQSKQFYGQTDCGWRSSN